MKFLLLLIFLVNIQVFAQKWVLNATPNFKLTSIGFFDASFTSTQNPNFKFDAIETNTTAFGNVASNIWTSSEIFIDVYELNKKWSFGLGFGEMPVFNRVGVSVENYYNNGGSNPTTNTQSIRYGAGFTGGVRYFHYSLSAKRQLYIPNKRFKQSLAAHFNVCQFRVSNESTGPNLPSSFIYFETQNYAVEEISYSNFSGIGRRNRIQLGATLRYEFSILNKKEKNLLNFNVSYFYGFLKVVDAYFEFRVHTVNGYGDDGTGLVPTARNSINSRTSHLSIGISKTFSFSDYDYSSSKRKN